MNFAIVVDFARFTPRVTSTSTSERTTSGARSVSAQRGEPTQRHPDDLRVRRELAYRRFNCDRLSAGQYT